MVRSAYKIGVLALLLSVAPLFAQQQPTNPFETGPWEGARGGAACGPDVAQ